MDGDEILSLVNRDLRLKNRFLGVFAADELPNHIAAGNGLIVNCCKRGYPGQHWLAVFKSLDAELEFFDSFGNTPNAYGLKIRAGDVIRFNHVQLPNLFFNLCGVFCIYYLFKRVRGYTLWEVQNDFSRNNTEFNDTIVINFICNNILYL